MCMNITPREWYCLHHFDFTTAIATVWHGGFDGLAVCMLVSGTQVRGFEPGRSRRIFQGKKILRMPSFGGEVKPSVRRRFAGCTRSLQTVWNSLFDGKINQTFLTHSSPFPARGLSRRRWRGASWRYKWELPKSGSYNKHADCSTSRGTVEEKEQCDTHECAQQKQH
jgi:hypothetical protein